MKNNTIIAVLLVLVLIFVVLINVFPFGANTSESFQNQMVSASQLKAARASRKEGYQNMRLGNSPTGPSMPMPPMPMPPMPMPPTPSMPNMPQMPNMPPMPPQVQPPQMPGPMINTNPQNMPNTPASTLATPQPMLTLDSSGNIVPGTQTSTSQGSTFQQTREGFANIASSSNGATNSYEPIGHFDGVALPSGNKVSAWRHTAPNEPLMGAEFTPGDDSLFMFKNNQCKPECCGASFSCSGGCVCTTPKQRDYLASRGGNRTKPEDSA